MSSGLADPSEYVVCICRSAASPSDHVELASRVERTSAMLRKPRRTGGGSVDPEAGAEDSQPSIIWATHGPTEGSSVSDRPPWTRFHASSVHTNSADRADRRRARWRWGAGASFVAACVGSFGSW